MKPKVLVTEAIHQAGWDLLLAETEAVAWGGPQAEPLEKALEGVQGVVVRVAKFPADMICGAKDLKVIAKHGVGYDNIDVKAATACGVVVTFTPAANSQSVAEHALALMFAVARRIGDFSRDLALKNLQAQKLYQGVELAGKTLGVIGVGGAGGRLARMAAQGIGMRVVGFDPYKDPWPEGIEKMGTLDDLLAQADFVSIHVPLTPETKNLIGAKTLAKMKPTAILVNTARGGIVDEAVLGEAILQERIAGAALDVVVDEPVKADHPLAGMRNVLLTSHVAGVTEEGMIGMATTAAEDVLRVLRGETPKYPVNREVLKK
jgi:D-3-phosphoglycerate dehydrogenase